ncbi:MAG: Minf_1886 family protein [Verrucomicrobiota bacterium]|nr:Minf_1886 family protein [Verrucomicrobiota bacterium]
MQKTDFHDAVEQVLTNDSSYSSDSYYFLQEVLLKAVEIQRKETSGENKHVTGEDLLDVFRDRALAQFGPMAMTVLQEWGLSKTEDIGDMVFNLIEAGAFGKSEHDKREDFMNGYKFHDAFVIPFLPKSKQVIDDNGDCRDFNIV